MRIWLVSPDPPFKALRELFERHGQEIVGSASMLDEVAQQIGEIQADVLFLNRYTPGAMTVSGLLWQIRSSRPDLRVVLLLGENDADAKNIKAAAISAGIYDWWDGGAITPAVIDLINRPRQFADVSREVPHELVQSMAHASEPEPVVDHDKQERVTPDRPRLRLPSIKMPSITIPRLRLGRATSISDEELVDQPRERPARGRRRVMQPAVRHVLLGFASPSSGAAFRAAAGFAAVWQELGGDVEIVAMDTLYNPWPMGAYETGKVYQHQRRGIRWYGFGTVATQEAISVLDEDVGPWVADAVRRVQRRRPKGPPATLLVLGSPFSDPVAKAGWLLAETVVWIAESKEDASVAAQWNALLQSLDMLPEDIIVANAGGGVIAGVMQTWNVEDGWRYVVQTILGRDSSEQISTAD